LGQLACVRGNAADAQDLFAKSMEIFERLQSPYADKVRQELTNLTIRYPNKGGLSP